MSYQVTEPAFSTINCSSFGVIHIGDATDNPSCLKYSQQGLRASFQCQECVSIIEKYRTSSDPNDYNETIAQEVQRLLSILNGRIQTFLKEMIKIYKITNNKKSIYEDYKGMYSISLRVNEASTTFPKDLYDAIERLKKIMGVVEWFSE
ncbi:unnamed protein product [Rotaria sordida]|uniref:EDRF1 TPR repeats region domain-containing protein n=1 Tax=Rotaria sordida TaxID=392033 RepID=A0A815HLB1_9BILA|nr:unnamed protein product [Rotaria sordida]CAF1604124.1 unnamed protein product [Rotaria sordida]